VHRRDAARHSGWRWKRVSRGRGITVWPKREFRSVPSPR
jgi:hypothetical protein